jgi:sporulation protein YlmC with PRC-barrel domain
VSAQGTSRGPIEAGTPLSLALRLLDHQVEGRDTEMLGNVDDVALEERDGRLVAVGILRGPIAWSLRQPGVLGAWGRAVARRLDPREDARPLVVPLDHVLAVGSAVHVDPWAERLLADTDGMELWLRAHLIARIPGARGGEHALGGTPGHGPRTDPELELPDTARLLSTLLDARVVRADGSDAGHVLEVRAEQVTPLDSRVGPLVVTSLVHGHRRLGSRLGYSDDPRMGPWVIGAALRWWHRGDEETHWADVGAVDWAARLVLLGPAHGADRR